MKITKRQLKRIISEALPPQGMADFGSKFDKAYKQPDGSYSGQPDQAPEGLYVNLTDDQEMALDDLENALERCMKSGCKLEDVMDTVKAQTSAGNKL